MTGLIQAMQSNTRFTAAMTSLRGAFDYTSGHYLSSTVVFASLASSRHPGG